MSIKYTFDKEEPQFRKKKGDFYGKRNFCTNNDADLYRNVPFNADCPKHGSGHTAGACMQNPYGPRYNRCQTTGYRNGARNNHPGNKNYGGRGRDYHNHQAQHNSGNQNNWNRNDRPNQQSNYYQGSFYQQNVPMQPSQNNGNQS